MTNAAEWMNDPVKSAKTFAFLSRKLNTGVLNAAQMQALDELTRKHTVSLRMAPGDAVLVDNYQTMHGRNVFKGTRKHAVSWFK